MLWFTQYNNVQEKIYKVSYFFYIPHWLNISFDNFVVI
jgi:hypothetical protein